MRFLKIFSITCILIVIGVWIVNKIINNSSNDYIFDNEDKVPKCYTGIVLGAKVSRSGQPSDFLHDRLDVAIQLYKDHKIKRFLLSGDHGQTDYDEVNSMKNYMIAHGIDSSDIFMDHAGFDTYSSMVRAKEIFKVEDAIIVSQKFHLSRAVYIARQKGLKAYGICADKREYSSIKKLKVREMMANIKAFYEVAVNRKPKFLGDTIPITGKSKVSYDK